MEKKLAGKCIVITGASSGAGRAAAEQFALAGAQLVLTARNAEVLESVADDCRKFDAEVLVVPTDVTDTGAMINLANAACNRFGKVDVWVNNAGVLAAGPFEEIPMAVHRQVIETNLLGYMNGAHAIVPIFKKQGTGILINNISIGGYLPVPYGGGYTASKFGLRGWSESLKAELAEYSGIFVCDLFPAFLDTPGILHAANYTKKHLKPAPPVYDPNRLAIEMVRLAIKPKANKHVGSASLLLKLANAVFPELTVKITGAVMRRYFNVANEMPPADGNVFTTVNYGMSSHGGYGVPGRPKAHRKYIAVGLAAGLAAGFLFFRKQ